MIRQIYKDIVDRSKFFFFHESDTNLDTVVISSFWETFLKSDTQHIVKIDK